MINKALLMCVSLFFFALLQACTTAQINATQLVSGASLTPDEQTFQKRIQFTEIDLKRQERSEFLSDFFEAYKKAVLNGDLNSVQLLVKNIQNTNPLHNLEKIALLDTAIFYKQPTIVKYVLQNLKVNWPLEPKKYENDIYASFQRPFSAYSISNTTLGLALKTEDRELINTVIKSMRLSQQDFDDALHQGWQNEETLKILLENGANLQARHSQTKRNVLEDAYRLFNLSQVQLLEAYGAKLSSAEVQEMARSITPGGAIKSDDILAVFKHLVAKGARFDTPRAPDQIPQIFQTYDLNVLKFLVDQGADLNTMYQNQNLLSYKISWGSENAVYFRYLLEKGIRVNPTQDFVGSPIRAAVFAGQLWLVKMLVEHGADIKTHAQELLNLAQEQKQTDIYDYLKAQGI